MNRELRDHNQGEKDGAKANAFDALVENFNPLTSPAYKKGYAHGQQQKSYTKKTKPEATISNEDEDEDDDQHVCDDTCYSSSDSSYSSGSSARYQSSSLSGGGEFLLQAAWVILSLIGEYWAGPQLPHLKDTDAYSWTVIIVALICLPGAFRGVLIMIGVSITLCVVALVIMLIIAGVQYILAHYKDVPTTQASQFSTHYGAIAYSSASGRCRYALDTSRSSAESKALAQCKSPDCSIMVWFSDACGAVAKTRNGQIGWAWAPSKSDAQRLALEECRKKGKGCNVICSVCASQ